MNIKKIAMTGATTAVMLGSLIAPAFAAAPAEPGCFGRDRAAYAKEFGSLGSQTGGVGYYASLRASENGEMNRAYKTTCGGDAQ